MLPRVLPLLLLSLLLLTAACKKEDEPTLLGRWYYDTSHFQEYDKNGTILTDRIEQIRPQGMYDAISATRIDWYDEKGQLISNSEYTRDGQALHIKEINLTTRQVKSTHELKILELTDQQLVCRYTSPKSNLGYYTVITTYTH